MVNNIIFELWIENTVIQFIAGFSKYIYLKSGLVFTFEGC